MKLENSRSIQAEPQVVWDNLVDVDILQQCIPGCESMEQTGDNEYALTTKNKIGPVSATFKGTLSLRDIVPGKSYTLDFNANGGAAGFSKGSSGVRLEPDAGGTKLYYTVDAKIGGRIAQVGQRLVDGAAHKMADDFFGRFEQIVAPAGVAPAEEAAPAGTDYQRWLWIGAGVLILIVILVLIGVVL